MPPDETVLEQVVETPPTEVVVETPPAEPAVATVAAVVDPAEEPKVPKTDWRDARIAKLTAQLKAAKAEPTPVQTHDGKTPLMPGTREFEDEVNRRALLRGNETAAQIAFAQQCETTVKEGKAAFEDWDDRISNLKQLFDPNVQAEVVAYNTFLAVAMETGDGPKILHELGGDLDEASRILGLHPTKMAIELTKLATGTGPAKVSQTPRPITPVGKLRANNATIMPDDPENADRLETAEWMKRREASVAKQEDQRRGARR